MVGHAARSSRDEHQATLSLVLTRPGLVVDLAGFQFALSPMAGRSWTLLVGRSKMAAGGHPSTGKRRLRPRALRLSCMTPVTRR